MFALGGSSRTGLLLAAFLAERHVLSVGDVQSIAREIRDELGPDAALSPVVSVAATESPSTAPLDAVTLQKQFNHLEERIDRLERTVSAAVDLLHRLLHPDKASKPSTPGRL
jgi:hypothetical protein